MDGTQMNRRTILRYTAIGVATGGSTALAGCGDPDDGEDDDGGGGGDYREDGVDPGSDQDAGTSDGGSSAG